MLRARYVTFGELYVGTKEIRLLPNVCEKDVTSSHEYLRGILEKFRWNRT